MKSITIPSTFPIYGQAEGFALGCLYFSPSLNSSPKQRSTLSTMAPGASSFEHTQIMTFNCTDDAELSFNGGLSDGGYSNITDPTCSDHYDQQLSYHADSSSSMFSNYTTEPAFPSSLDPSPNLFWYNDSNGGSLASMTPTNYHQDLSL